MREFVARRKLMGCAFELLVVHEDENAAQALLDLGIAEIQRLEQLLSEFLPHSETSRINNRPVDIVNDIDPECFQLIERCMAISKLTNGSFDITVSPLKSLYSFRNGNFALPEENVIERVRETVGYHKVRLGNRQIHFRHRQSRISFAAIGKGYASDQVKKLWMKEGVTSGYVNASGDLNAFGRKADGTCWRIGIIHPEHPDQPFMHVPVENASVATSGDYEQYFVHQGKRYSHSINPYTGKPLTGIQSVSIFSPAAELSDALATAVSVMGCDEGIAFVNELPQTHAIIIDDRQRVHLSKSIDYEEVPV